MLITYNKCYISLGFKIINHTKPTYWFEEEKNLNKPKKINLIWFSDFLSYFYFYRFKYEYLNCVQRTCLSRASWITKGFMRCCECNFPRIFSINIIGWCAHFSTTRLTRNDYIPSRFGCGTVIVGCGDHGFYLFI